MLSNNLDANISSSFLKERADFIENDKVGSADYDDGGSASESSIFARNYDTHLIE